MFYISYIWILRKLRMTETLVYLLCKCPLTYHTVIRPESHIGSLRRESLLVLHDVDDIVLSFRGEFLTRCIHDTEDIASIFDRHDLRAETDAEIGDPIYSCILCCHDHPFCASRPESSWDTDPIESFEKWYR